MQYLILINLCQILKEPWHQFVSIRVLSGKKITFAPLEKGIGIHEKYPEFLHHRAY
jgi:hypothetical protein